MRKKALICIVCPNGCQLEAEIVEGETIKVSDIDGNLCKKGVAWAEQELTNPLRTISSSIIVEGGDFPLVSVRTDRPVPLPRIPGIMKAIRSARANAPVQIGDILIEGAADTCCNIIATRNVNREDKNV